MTAELVSIKPPDRGSGGRPPEDDPRRCTAHLSDGSGERCQRWASEGTNTCPSHGGKTGKKAARVRGQIDLFDLLPIATRRHKEVLQNSTDERVILKATEMVYDRTGLEAKSGLNIDSTVVRETALSQFLQVKEGRPVPDDEEDEDIVEAEIVDDSSESVRVVVCHACGVERWDGIGPCTNLRSDGTECGALTPKGVAAEDLI